MIRFALMILLFPVYCISQQWTLDQCIDSAIQNNLSIQSSNIKSQIERINLSNSKSALLPSLNTGITHGYNWGQTIDLFTNQFATNRVQYDNFFCRVVLCCFPDFGTIMIFG